MNYHTGELAIRTCHQLWIELILTCMQSFSVTSNMHLIKACLHGGWARQVGEVTCRVHPTYYVNMIKLKWEIIQTGGLLHLSGLSHRPEVLHLQVNRPLILLNGSPRPLASLLLLQWVNLKQMNKAALWSANNYIIIGAFDHFFLPNARNRGYARMKDLGYAMDSQSNCGYVWIEDLGCAVDSQGIVVMLEWEI